MANDARLGIKVTADWNLSFFNGIKGVFKTDL